MEITLYYSFNHAHILYVQTYEQEKGRVVNSTKVGDCLQ